MLKCLIAQYFLVHGLQKTNQYIHWKLLPKIIFETYKHAVLVQLLCPTLCTPWTAAHQASMSFTISRSLPKFMSIESVMLSSLLIPCRPLLLLPSAVPSIRETCHKANENISLWIVKSVHVIYTYRSTNKSKKRN